MNELDLTSGINYRLKPNQPIVCELQDQKVASAVIQGDPNSETAKLMPPLYASAYGIRKIYKENHKMFKVEKLRGRWHNASLDLAKSKWSGIYALPIPNDVTTLPEIKKDKNPEQIPLKIETWHYGKVDMILHIGPYTTEDKTVQQLLDFIAAQNLSIIPNSHEEIYISSPETMAEKRFFAERELKSRLTKAQLRFADHALEFRARWIHESVGYGDSSCNIKDGDRLPAGSAIPIGCEIPEVVAKAINALDLMMKDNREYVLILNKITLIRKKNENIANLLKKTSYSAKQYRAAREKFASILNNL